MVETPQVFSPSNASGPGHEAGCKNKTRAVSCMSHSTSLDLTNIRVTSSEGTSGVVSIPTLGLVLAFSHNLGGGEQGGVTGIRTCCLTLRHGGESVLPRSASLSACSFPSIAT